MRRQNGIVSDMSGSPSRDDGRRVRDEGSGDRAVFWCDGELSPSLSARALPCPPRPKPTPTARITMSRFYRGDDSDSDRSDAGSDAGSDDEKLENNKRGPSAKTRELFEDENRCGFLSRSPAMRAELVVYTVLLLYFECWPCLL